MPDFDKLDESGQPVWLELPAPGGFRVNAAMTEIEIEREMLERLLAVLTFRGLPRTPAGVREIMLQQLLEQGAPLEVVTDTDLIKGGRDGAAFRTYVLRSEADRLKKTGQARNNVEAARVIFKKKGQKLAFGTILKLLSQSKSDAARARHPKAARWKRRRDSLSRVVRALDRVVAGLEKITK